LLVEEVFAVVVVLVLAVGAFATVTVFVAEEPQPPSAAAAQTPQTNLVDSQRCDLMSPRIFVADPVPPR
jgi:hypothetical protein